MAKSNIMKNDTPVYMPEVAKVPGRSRRATFATKCNVSAGFGSRPGGEATEQF
jgi:hypothetical protein